MFSTASTYGLPRSKSITSEEMTKIVTHAKEHDPQLYVFCTIGSGLGLRLCEIVHIKTSDFVDGQLQVVRRKKKNLKPELIEVPPGLYAVMSEWAQMHDGWLFPGSARPCIIKHLAGGQTQVCEGGHLSKRAFQRRWELNLARCGLSMKGRGVHSMRHFAVTAMYTATRDLRAAQMFAAHSSSQITERYAKVVDMREKIHALKPIL